MDSATNDGYIQGHKTWRENVYIGFSTLLVYLDAQTAFRFLDKMQGRYDYYQDAY